MHVRGGKPFSKCFKPVTKKLSWYNSGVVPLISWLNFFLIGKKGLMEISDMKSMKQNLSQSVKKKEMI